MTEPELRTKIRELMASGALPNDTPSIERRGALADLAVRNPLPAPCTICGEPGPQVALFYLAGRVVELHAACEAAGKLERETGVV